MFVGNVDLAAEFELRQVEVGKESVIVVGKIEMNRGVDGRNFLLCLELTFHDLE